MSPEVVNDVQRRVAALRNQAFELASEITRYGLRDARVEISSAAVVMQDVANSLGDVEALVQPGARLG